METKLQRTPARPGRRPAHALALCLAAALLPLTTAYGQSDMAGQWIEVKGGTWAVDTGIFVEMADKLQRVADSAAKVEIKPVMMEKYTVQYQGQGQGKSKLVHITGACKVDAAAATKLTSQWYVAPNAAPGCNFEADYSPAEKSYVKIVFLGV
jgi:hypothetical protein